MSPKQKEAKQWWETLTVEDKCNYTWTVISPKTSYHSLTIRQIRKIYEWHKK